MKTIQSMIYLSRGSLPSKMANSIQVAKMAQAFSQKIKDFELVTCGDICSMLRGMDAEFQNWYGLQKKFKLVRLPMHIRVKYPFPANYDNQNFYKLAVLYACLKSPSLVFTRSPNIAAILLKIGIPVLWEWHEPVREDSVSTYREFFINKNLIGVVTTLPQLAENYNKHGLPTEKILVYPNGVDLMNFLPYQEKILARQKLSLPQDVKIIVYSGHLYNYKGIPTVLATARLLPEYKFILVGGWSDDVIRVKKDCEENNLNNVYIVGHVSQSDLASYLYAADILILPTSKSWDLAEATCPLKMFDYMATKRPIVASALPTIMTVLRDQHNALLVEPDEPVSFKKAIVTLFENSLLASTIAERAFQTVKNLTWDSRAESILQFAAKRLQEVDKNATDLRRSLLKYSTQQTVSALKYRLFLP